MQKNTDDTKRLEILSAYDILDTPSESPFDRITRLAQAVLQAPIAMLSFVDKNRQWIKSTQGFDIRELPRDISLCAHTIENNEPLVLTDARLDERFRANPLVVGEPRLRFYAGAPLTVSGGFRLGTLCAMDPEPREISEQQIASLQDLARLAVDQLELRKMALSDSLTGLCTRRAFLGEAARQAATAKKFGRALGCLIFDIDNFRLLNQRYGNAAGDLVLQSITDVCRRELRKIDVPSRIGSEEFGVLLPETAMGGAIRTAERLREAIEAAIVIYAGNRIPMTASIGVSVLGAAEENASGMIERCERALLEAKSNGRNRAAILAPAGDELQATQRARIAARR